MDEGQAREGGSAWREGERGAVKSADNWGSDGRAGCLDVRTRDWECGERYSG